MNNRWSDRLNNRPGNSAIFDKKLNIDTSFRPALNHRSAAVCGDDGFPNDFQLKILMALVE